ncbi:hypothetical protein D9M71_119220 [compost metagenome]
MLASTRSLDRRIECQQVGLLGDAFDHLQHAADGLAVGRQLVDHDHRLIDLPGQLDDAALLGLHQTTPADGFLVHALRTVHCCRRAARHFQGRGRHLVHGRGDLFDLAALSGHGLVALGRDSMHLARLALDFNHRAPHLLDQVVDALHSAVEHLAQLTQLVTALGLVADGHVAGRDLVHDRAQATEGRTGRGIEATVQIHDHQEHRGQCHHQQHHVQAVLDQPFLQLFVDKAGGGFIQLIGLVHQAANLVVEGQPGCIEGIGHHHLAFKHLGGLLERGAAGVGEWRQRSLGLGACTQYIVELEAVIDLQLIQLLLQFFEAIAGRGIEETLAQGIGAHGPAVTNGLGDLRRDAGDQLAELAHDAVIVLAQACLAGNDLAHDLCMAQYLVGQGAFTLQGGFALGTFQCCQHFIALGIEHLDLCLVRADSRQALDARGDALLKASNPRLQVTALGRLPQHHIDVDQVGQGFHVPSQGHAAVQQVQAVQLCAGTLEFTPGIAHQVEVGH